MRIMHISWEEYHRLILRLSRKINFKPSVIICINRGGLIIGRIISEILNRPLAVISANSYHGKRRSKLKLGPVSATCQIKGSVLLVDDLVDSGATLDKIKKKIEKIKGVKLVKSACLFKKTWSKLTPDFFVKEVDDWVVFPYEKK